MFTTERFIDGIFCNGYRSSARLQHSSAAPSPRIPLAGSDAGYKRKEVEVYPQLEGHATTIIFTNCYTSPPIQCCYCWYNTIQVFLLTNCNFACHCYTASLDIPS